MIAMPFFVRDADSHRGRYVRAIEHVKVCSPNLEHRRDFARIMSALEPGQTVSWVYRVAKEHGIGTEVELR